MKYEFYESNGYAYYGDTYIPGFDILDKKYKILDSLSGLSGKYIREIVSKMEDVRDGKLVHYRFGPEVCVIVINGKNFNDEEYRNKCIIFSEYSDIEIEIPFSEIYNLMKDYLFEIDKWEKKTGKEKPGW